MNAPAPRAALPRGNYTGSPLCAPRSGRRFYQCPICGGWVDSADLAQMVEHEAIPSFAAVEAAPIEIAEAS
jgi:Zn-finger nucleic acid-binding protein